MKWVALFMFGTVGLVALGGGLIWGFNRLSLYRNGVEVTGRVVENEASRGGRSTSYYPRVTFTARDGTVHSFKGSTGSSPPDYTVGDEVQVLYRPEAPAVAMISGFTQFWLGPLGVSVFGLLFLGAGVGSFVLVRSSDETFGPAFMSQISRAQLFDAKQGVVVKTQVREVEEHRHGDTVQYVLVCATLRPDGSSQVFRSPPLVVALPGNVVGKPVDVYVDPYDAKRFYVHVEPLFGKTG